MKSLVLAAALAALTPASAGTQTFDQLQRDLQTRRAIEDLRQERIYREQLEDQRQQQLLRELRRNREAIEEGQRPLQRRRGCNILDEIC